MYGVLSGNEKMCRDQLGGRGDGTDNRVVRYRRGGETPQATSNAVGRGGVDLKCREGGQERGDDRGWKEGDKGLF